MCFPQVLQSVPILLMISVGLPRFSCSFKFIHDIQILCMSCLIERGATCLVPAASDNYKTPCSLDTLGHWSDMDLQETGYGPWMMSIHQ